MTVRHPGPGCGWRWEPAPGWPRPPYPEWIPPPGWQPDPSWPAAPADHEHWHYRPASLARQMLLWAAGLIAGGVGLAAFATWLAAQPRPGGANIGAGLLAFLGYYAAAIGVVMLACGLWIGRRARRVVRRTLVDCDVRGVIRAE